MTKSDERFSRTDSDAIEFKSESGKVKAKFEFNDELMEFLTEDERKMLELTVAGFSSQLAGIIENKRGFEADGLSVKDGLAVTVTKLMEASKLIRGKD